MSGWRGRVCNAEDGGKIRRVYPLIFADFSEGRVTNPSAEMGVGRYYWQEDFPENQPFVCGWVGRSLSSEARWVGASINGAAGIRCCDLRYPESVGIIRVASGEGEQEMIAEFSRRFRTPYPSADDLPTTCCPLIGNWIFRGIGSGRGLSNSQFERPRSRPTD